MKNFNVFGIHWKIRILRVGRGGSRKKRGVAEKGGLGQFVDLRRNLARKRGWCF